ncbi:hypothetical protein CC78DRAFT_82404 [Lojkania enalia]|uniref:Uncharacterized protein n=1 Tax=Lojkania enalia TaxID=147567 RepID=A0A9P4N1V7_9PLEO|nr:hypothetical protein CC78DRAFT_82404 [Didymosphaeria enalia]
MLHPTTGIDFTYINRSSPLAGLCKSVISYSTVADYTEASINMADIVDLSSESITTTDSMEEPSPQRNKRRRLGTASHSTFHCAGCKRTLQGNNSVYFLPFCGCVSALRQRYMSLCQPFQLYCGPCVIRPILDGLRSEGALGRAAVDLIFVHMGNEVKPPASSINLFKCGRRGHPQILGAMECYGTACSICTAEGSLSPRCMYLPCGK